jgi:hypothetical protein
MIRTNEHAKLDEEDRILEELEEQLIENVRYFWKKTREYGLAGHDDWRDVQDPETGQWFCTGCDCNRWNRIELHQAIRRLRAWRLGIWQAY